MKTTLLLVVVSTYHDEIDQLLHLSIERIGILRRDIGIPHIERNGLRRCCCRRRRVAGRGSRRRLSSVLVVMIVIVRSIGLRDHVSNIEQSFRSIRQLFEGIIDAFAGRQFIRHAAQSNVSNPLQFDKLHRLGGL